MCGIVGYVTLKPRAGLANFLGQGLIVDSLRGMCGTGIYGWDDKTKEATVWKRALTGADFVNTHQFEQYKDSAHKLSMAIGHNRASTIGSAKDVNCHPFVYDHIGLVHNGTLRNYHSLLSYQEFTHQVDSAYAAKAISKFGAVEALEKIDGAFVFVWHDAIANTFNITRNSMRDIWYITDKEGENLYFASEYQMLDWLLERNNLSTIGKYRSPAEFNILTWDLSKPLLKPKVTPYQEYQPPKFNYPSRSNTPYVWKGRTKDEEELAELGLEQFEMLPAKHWEFSLYANGDKGKLEGTVLVKIGETTKEHKFRLHGFDKKDVDRLKDAESLLVQASSVWYEGETPLILSRSFKIIPKGSLPEVDSSEDMFRGPNGHWFTKDSYIDLIAGGCSYCGSPIDLEESEVTKWILVGSEHEPICKGCSENSTIMGELSWYQKAYNKENLM